MLIAINFFTGCNLIKFRSLRYFTLLFIAFLASSISVQAGPFKEAKHKMEIVPFRASFNTGLYKSRLAEWTDIRQRQYAQPSFMVQLYLPFKRSVDTPESFEEGYKNDDYYDRLFAAKPFLLFHLTEKLGNASGLGQELTFRVHSRWFANIQLAVAWVESPANTNDGLKTGWNFHNYWYLSCFVTKKFTLNAGYIHISNGRVWTPDQSSLFDMITVGTSFNLHR